MEEDYKLETEGRREFSDTSLFWLPHPSPETAQGLLLSLLAAGWAGASEAPGESSSWLERQPGDLSEREL